MTEKSNVRVRHRTRKKNSEGTITKSMTKKVSGEVTDNVEVIERFPFHTPSSKDPAYVCVSLSETRAPINFESVKVSISVTVPCDPNQSSITQAFDKTAEMTENFLSIEMGNALEEYNGRA
jgi:hypothetical protein